MDASASPSSTASVWIALGVMPTRSRVPSTSTTRSSLRTPTDVRARTSTRLAGAVDRVPRFFRSHKPAAAMTPMPAINL